MLLASAPAFAHGVAPGPPDAGTLLTGWSFAVEIWLPLALAAAAYWLAFRKVNREHPANPVPRRRLAFWLAGLGVLVLALQSPIERYDTTLFSVHMVQHLLLTMAAAPLLALAGPITLLLRVATPDGRKRVILPILHSRPVRLLTHPLVAWVVFTGFMFFSHFSPLFDAALENPGIHLLEHALYLGTAMLFWWPAVGVDPSPWRLRHGGRLLYLGLGMPWSSFLGLAIFSANDVLYRHYATLQRSWGWTPLEDQAWAGGIMWAGGDAVFLVALVLALARWLRAEEVEGRRLDARLDREALADRQ
ncbi:MAG: putative rane protein [Chloroflexota bacterium]|nr:putative rane protein [Chloroflexota bacterium]